MEKRVDRNKELYVVVNEKIKQRALKTSNSELQETQNKLKGINPSLFGGEEVDDVSINKPNNKKKKIIVTSIIFAIIFLIIILVAVVISNGK